MNRVILIGNGFDLSHNLKTSYGDFVFWHFLMAFQNLANPFNRLTPPSPLLDLEKDEYFRYELPENLETKLINQMVDNGIVKIVGVDKGNRMRHEDNSKPKKPKNQLFVDSLKDLIDGRWVDFEIAFYRKLIEVLFNKGYRLPTGYLHSNGKAYINTLNRYFEEIKTELEVYLSKVVGKDTAVQVMEEYLDLFFSPLVSHHKKDALPDSITFLNFNYTDIIKRYIEVWNNEVLRTIDNTWSRNIPINVIDIHGQIEDSKNPINFGFGSELDQNFQELLRLQDNCATRFVKNNDYNLTPGYQQLLRLIQKPYELFVFGHSCGQSDGNLLHQIFDNKNLVGIKIFPYQGYDHYRNTRNEIRLHCNNPGDLDLKIQVYDPNSLCPQLSTTLGPTHRRTG